MALTEFDLIDRYFARRTGMRRDVRVGIGDDAAVLRMRAGHELAVTIDTLTEGVHFPANSTAADIGYRAMAVNLSDLAAMGAEPAWATLALTLPEPDEAWLDDFAEGFMGLAAKYGVQLVGGDTTRGPLALTVALHGWVPNGSAVLRVGARDGDGVYVSGTVGDASMGLSLLQADHANPSADEEYLIQRFLRPVPRIELGAFLRGRAHSAIDVSDGLAADLHHILERSAVGAVIEVELLPLSAALRSCRPIDRAWQFALSGGDDYELCFTAPATREQPILDWAAGAAVPVTRIGRIVAEPGLRVVDAQGADVQMPSAGYRHF